MSLLLLVSSVKLLDKNDLLPLNLNLLQNIEDTRIFPKTIYEASITNT